MGNDRQVDYGGTEEVWRGLSSGYDDPADLPAVHAPRSSRHDAPTRLHNGTTALPVIGYASCVHASTAVRLELKQQAEVITRECKRRGFALIEVVGERAPEVGKSLNRPGLAYALDRIQSGDAGGLVVVELARITQSVAELGLIMEWLQRQRVRLVASADEFDTDCDGGRLAAALLIGVSGWERNRISERTRSGLQAARTNGRAAGRPAVADDPDLSKRIAEMRAQGMTLQAIADRLNEEGVPTVRGGSKWRHSSVQAAAGYRRRVRPPRGVIQIPATASGVQDEPAPVMPAL